MWSVKCPILFIGVVCLISMCVYVFKIHYFIIYSILSMYIFYAVKVGTSTTGVMGNFGCIIHGTPLCDCRFCVWINIYIIPSICNSHCKKSFVIRAPLGFFGQGIKHEISEVILYFCVLKTYFKGFCMMQNSFFAFTSMLSFVIDLYCM